MFIYSQISLKTLLATNITPEDWNSCINNIITMYKELGNKFIQLKIICRWHRTPQQLHIWKLIPSDTCWRCNETGASIFHILWTCPALKYWWENILQILHELLSKKFTVSAKTIILGSTCELKDSDLFPSEKKWIILAVTTVKCILLRHWRKKYPPPYEE